MQSLALAIRSLPQVTIAKLRGRLRGGGNELAMAADLRYAAAGETWMSQIESPLGIIPGGGGSTMLTELVGRSRTLEAVLTGDLYDAKTAELYGWINLAIEPDHLDELVDGLAHRIASRLPQQIAAAKAITDPHSTDKFAAGFARELSALGMLYPAADSFVELVRRALAGGAQSRDGELDLEGAIERAAKHL
ncbi:MAG: enoyl-CoA hydratase/isomerase family protein [Solirubrobacteraceae bacterium]